MEWDPCLSDRADFSLGERMNESLKGIPLGVLSYLSQSSPPSSTPALFRLLPQEREMVIKERQEV